MKIIPAGNSVYCDTGPHEGKHRVQATVYLSSEELALMQQNLGEELIVIRPDHEEQLKARLRDPLGPNITIYRV